MLRKGFHYKVEAACVFSGEELWILFENASSHYDSRCRGTARPAVAPGCGGEIWGMMNRFCKGELKPEETSEEWFKRNCMQRPLDVLEIDLPSRTIDTLRKCVEFAPSDAPALRSLQRGLREVHQAINHEYVAQNKIAGSIPEESAPERNG